jgi:hypothetical protein
LPRADIRVVESHLIAAADGGWRPFELFHFVVGKRSGYGHLPVADVYADREGKDGCNGNQAKGNDRGGNKRFNQGESAVL